MWKAETAMERCSPEQLDVFFKAVSLEYENQFRLVVMGLKSLCKKTKFSNG
jgi:hypothetical protein